MGGHDPRAGALYLCFWASRGHLRAARRNIAEDSREFFLMIA
jgi:hypothetical protein